MMRNNDNRFWKRNPDGVDTDSESDWRFGLQTLEEGVMRGGTVIHVRDGDTIYISPVAMAGVQSVRLVCIDAPELETQEGKECKAFLEGLCLGKEVEFDVDDCRQYGKYNRILAMVYVNGTNLNQEMLKKDGCADFLYYLPLNLFLMQTSHILH